jgi:outer membrane protein OmpA-like peptidoglycan-associated protein
MNQLISSLLLIVLVPFCLFSQGGIGSTVLLKGKVINLKNGSPIETKFYLVDGNGKKIQIKTSLDGSYSIPISQSGSYSITSEKWMCVDPIMVNVQVQQNYYEKEQNLYFVPFEPGLSIRKVIAFDENSAELTAEGKNSLKLLAELSKNNPNLAFNIVIRTNQSIFKKTTKTISEGKKKVTITPEQQAQELGERRAKAIRQFLTENKMPERNFSFRLETYSSSQAKQTKTSKGKSKTEGPVPPQFNLEILIDKILNFDLEKK